MSTPLTATAMSQHALPHLHSRPYRAQPSFRDNQSGFYNNHNLTTTRPGGSSSQYGYPPTPNSAIINQSSTLDTTVLSRPVLVAPAHYKQDSQAVSVTGSQSGSQKPSRKRERSPNWQEFYRNGLPDEVIVIHDSSPSPSVPESVEPEPLQQHPMPSNNRSRQPAKRQKRDQAFDPVYHVEPGPGHGTNSSNSTISTDRTTSAVQTTAATSLGSQYSSNGSRPYVNDEAQTGLKRKRVATRQQLAAEAKRKESESRGAAYVNYHPPPRPPVKAGEVHVKAIDDVSERRFDDQEKH